MNISERIAIAVAESSLPFHRCKACQRQGLPILPLRRALVPDTRFGSDPTTQTRLGLRTLRSGYLSGKSIFTNTDSASSSPLAEADGVSSLLPMTGMTSLQKPIGSFVLATEG